MSIRLFMYTPPPHPTPSHSITGVVCSCFSGKSVDARWSICDSASDCTLALQCRHILQLLLHGEEFIHTCSQPIQVISKLLRCQL